MKARTTAILLVLAVIALGAGWWLTHPPATDRAAMNQAATGTTAMGTTAAGATAAGTLVFPTLAAHLGEAAAIEISHQKSTLSIVRNGAGWGLADHGGYKVQPSRVRELLQGLIELRATEPRTSDPAEYKRLGVEDPNDPVATGDGLRVLTAQGTPLAELIVGHRRVRMQGNLPESVYIRRPGDAQSWLAEGRLPADADSQQWIDRAILNVDHARVAGVTVQRQGATLVFERKGDALTLTAAAGAPKLDDYKVQDVGSALENLSLTDVKPAAQQPGEKTGTSAFTLADGELIVATVFRAGTPDKPETWAQFAVTGEGAAKAAAETLEAQVKGWTFQLGAWKEPALLPNLDVLKASEPKAPGASGVPDDPAGQTDPATPADPAAPADSAVPAAPGAPR